MDAKTDDVFALQGNGDSLVGTYPGYEHLLIACFAEVNDVGGQRVWAGRNGDGLASISLAGQDGKERIRLQVTADGKGSIVFLDATGKVAQELAPTK